DVNQRYQSPQEVADALEPWTQTPIPPPPDNEMPQFSLAATRALCETGTGGNSLTSRPPSDHNSPLPRKVWQVSGSGQATATAPEETDPPGPEFRKSRRRRTTLRKAARRKDSSRSIGVDLEAGRRDADPRRRKRARSCGSSLAWPSWWRSRPLAWRSISSLFL